MFGFGKNKNGTIEAVVAHLKPQIQKINAKGQRFHISEITLAYIAAVHMALSKNNSFNTEQLRQAVAQIFPNHHDQMAIGNAFIFVTQVTDEFVRKVGTLLPIAEKEIKSGAGDYYVRYNEFGVKETDAIFDTPEDYDPRESNYDSNAYLKV